MSDGSESGVCGAKTKGDGSPCQRSPSKGKDRCHYHGGATPTKDENPNQGAPEGNSNAVQHGGYREPEFLKSDIVDTPLEDTFHATHEALCSRYERKHGWIDAAIEKDLEEIALMYVKRDLIDIHARDNAAENSPLVESRVIDTTDDGRPVEIKDVNKLQGLWTDLRRESRLLLKDMGLYHDPESQKAGAIESSLSELLSEEH